MKKSYKYILFIFFLIIIISLIKSSTVTIEVVQISNIKDHSLMVIDTQGQKTKLSVPSNIDTSNLNEKSQYLIQYRSNIFKVNKLIKIEKIKEAGNH
ncbi:hypothetical protein D3C75_517210 [compost metagenome]